MLVFVLCSYICLALLICADFYFGVRYITIAGLTISVVGLASYYGFKFAMGFKISINRRDKGVAMSSGSAGVTSTVGNTRLAATRSRDFDVGQEATIQDETTPSRSNITYITQRNVKPKPPPLFK